MFLTLQGFGVWSIRTSSWRVLYIGVWKALQSCSLYMLSSSKWLPCPTDAVHSPSLFSSGRKLPPALWLRLLGAFILSKLVRFFPFAGFRFCISSQVYCFSWVYGPLGPQLFLNIVHYLQKFDLKKAVQIYLINILTRVKIHWSNKGFIQTKILKEQGEGSATLQLLLW